MILPGVDDKQKGITEKRSLILSELTYLNDVIYEFNSYLKSIGKDGRFNHYYLKKMDNYSVFDGNSNDKMYNLTDVEAKIIISTLLERHQVKYNELVKKFNKM